jgi:hypothetical protein
MREAFAGRVLLMWTTFVVPAGLIWVLGVVVLLQLHPDALTEDVTPFFRVLQAGLVSGGWTCAGFAGAGVVGVLGRGWGWWLGRRSRVERERLDASVAHEAVLEAPNWEPSVSGEE